MAGVTWSLGCDTLTCLERDRLISPQLVPGAEIRVKVKVLLELRIRALATNIDPQCDVCSEDDSGGDRHDLGCSLRT